MKINFKNNDRYDDIKNKEFFNQFKCIKKIGKGSFGRIYKAVHNNEYFALKFEINDEKTPQLLHIEKSFMKHLGCTNIPYIKLYSSTYDYNILVMQLLGKNLEMYHKKYKKFTLKTTCMLGNQILSILEDIHDNNIVHCDLKPDNLCMGIDSLSQYVFMIDFGCARLYRDSTTLIEYPIKHIEGLNGTPRYASINALRGYEQSRKDDLESLAYILIYFLKGELPWQGITAKTNKEINIKILDKKKEISSSKLCEGLPIEFEKFLEYIKNIERIKRPDYDFLRNLLMNAMKENNLKYDYVFDWSTKSEIENNSKLILKKEFLKRKSISSKHSNNRKYGILNIEKKYKKMFNRKKKNKFYENQKDEISCSNVCYIY